MATDPVPDGPAELVEAARSLENALVGAMHREVRRRDRIALAFSGGLDSTVLAELLRRHFDGDVTLVVAGVAGCVDATRARSVARLLRLPLVEAVVTSALLERTLPALVRLVGPDPGRAGERGSSDAAIVSPVMVAVQATLHVAFAEARRHATHVVLGQGADELFGGYHRYLAMDRVQLERTMRADLASLQDVARPIEARVAAAHGIDLGYPYLEEGVVHAAQRVPVGVHVRAPERKRVLRALAGRLGLPPDVAATPKTAAQYGSGVSGLLRRLAQRAGVRQTDYVTRLFQASARRAGALDTVDVADAETGPAARNR